MVRGYGLGAVKAVGGVVRRRGGMIGGGVILALLVWRLGSGPFVRALHTVSGPALVAAVLIGAATTVLSAWRWALVAGGLGIRLPLHEAVGDYYRSLFLNSVLPGGVLGDVHRAVRHGRDVGDVALAAKAVVLERAAGQIVLLLAGTGIVLAGWTPVPWPSTPPSAWWLLAAVPLAALAVTLWLRRRSRAAAAVRAWGGHARRGLLSRQRWPGIVLTSAAALGGHLTLFVVAARSVGSTAPVTRLAPLLLLALLAMALPLNVGGWGPREAVTTWAFAAAGLDAGQGLTMAVGYGVLALVASLPGAAVLAGERWVRRRGQGATTAAVTRTVAPAVAVQVAQVQPVRVRPVQPVRVRSMRVEPTSMRVQSTGQRCDIA